MQNILLEDLVQNVYYFVIVQVNHQKNINQLLEDH